MRTRLKTLRFILPAILFLLALYSNAQHPSEQVPLTKENFEKALKASYEKWIDYKEGANADYIPVLAEVPSDLFSISICDMDGNVYEMGDTDHKFSIQSVSKVFTLAMVMQELGSQAIYDTVGVNATGRLFNSIVAIEDKEDRPSNSLVNAGAIATTSLVKGDNYDEKWNRIISTFSKYAARDLDIDIKVYQSEAATNQRNRAIAMLLDSYNRIYYDPLESVDIYTRQCAIAVNSHDLSIMAATLANGGVNPVTGEKMVEAKFLPKIFAVMTTAGLYDDSGKWLYFVGLPGKSGVGGGVIAVAPGKFGIAAFSPRLDESGNSVRGVRSIISVNEELGINIFYPN